jgi:hypothetical protein
VTAKKIICVGAWLVIIAAGLLGCQSIFNYKTGVITDTRQIIPFPAAESTNTWENRDVKISYRFIPGSGKLEISGRIEFAARFIEYASLEEFDLCLTLVDPQGHVLDMVGVANTAHADFDPLVFKKTISLPSNASGMVFTYTGGVSSWDSDERIWNYPIKR